RRTSRDARSSQRSVRDWNKPSQIGRLHRARHRKDHVAVREHMKATTRSKQKSPNLCGPLRISASSALKSAFNAENTEIRRGPQRKVLDVWRELIPCAILSRS